jgi:phospholipase/carboxylesterase
MIVMHGQGDSIDSFKDFDYELDLPWMNFLLLNAPEKFDDGFSWYDLEPRHAKGVKRSRKLLQQLIFDLNYEGWRNKDIYLLGHSQGALMASDLVLNSKDPFAALISVSGYVWFFRGWKKQALQGAAAKTPWLMTYGIRDNIIPPEEVTEDIEILCKAGLPVTSRAFKKGHDFNMSREVPFIHNWVEFLTETQALKSAQNLTSPWMPREALPLVSAPRRYSNSRSNSRARTRIRL